MPVIIYVRPKNSVQILGPVFRADCDFSSRGIAVRAVLAARNSIRSKAQKVRPAFRQVWKILLTAHGSDSKRLKKSASSKKKELLRRERGLRATPAW